MEYGTQSYSIKCDPQEATTKISMHSSEPYLEQLCTVNYPKAIRQIRIERILNSVKERAIHAIDRINGTYAEIANDVAQDANELKYQFDLPTHLCFVT